MFEKYRKLLEKYTDKGNLIKELFSELEIKYTDKKRYYHNFNHISDMLDFSEKFEKSIENYDDLCFAIWYHDVIYEVTSKNSEEKSAEFAGKHLKKINYPNIENVKYLIKRTANHFLREENESQELQLLLDLDLKTLGSQPEIYFANSAAIRKEYSKIPDILFNPGRAKFLRNMLETEKIYRNQYFIDNFEQQARENLKNELDNLLIY